MHFYILICLIFTSCLLAEQDLSWLTAKKTAIVDDKQNEFVIKGVNLGSWLAEEMWMLPITQEPPSDSPYTMIQDHVSLWQAFEKRFGKEKMEEIRTHYRRTWIQDADFARIKAAGFNTVRLPFLYDLHNEPGGLFFWLDHAVDLAKRNGIYIILDMHGVPGRQSNSMHTGEVDKGHFFSDEQFLHKTCQIWKEIARHYKNCPTIAGYDLVNEPMAAPGHKELYKMYDKIYKAVRQEDKKHIIFFQDGYKGISRFPKPKEFKWENVSLSTHHYVFEPNSTQEHITKFDAHIKKVEEKQKEAQVPFYLGEFNVAPRGSFEALEHIMKTLHQKKMSYTFWSYKIGKNGHKRSLWALYFPTGRIKKINPFKDSFKDVIKKIDRLSTSHYAKNSALITLLAN